MERELIERCVGKAPSVEYLLNRIINQCLFAF